MDDKALLDAIRSIVREEVKVETEPLKANIADLQESLQLVRTSQLKVELEQYPRIAAALDGVVGGIEKNKEQDGRILVLENKSESHSNRISALEYALKAK